MVVYTAIFHCVVNAISYSAKFHKIWSESFTHEFNLVINDLPYSGLISWVLNFVKRESCLQK